MKTAIFMLLLMLSGCVSESAMLKNPQGQVVQCNNMGWGWIGAPVAMVQHADCMKKAHAAGYSETPATQTP